MTETKPAVRRDWLSKSLAGAILGSSFAFVCSGLLVLALSGLPMGIRGQLAMWSVPPIALAVLSSVYFFRSGLRAWLWLGAVNLLAFGLLIAFGGS